MKSNIKITTRLFRGAAILGFAIFSAALAADVTLNTSVQKVENYLTDDGQRKTRLVAAEEIVPGDELRYVIEYFNAGAQVVDSGTIVITDSIPGDTTYLLGSAFGSGTDISFSTDGGSDFAVEEDLRIQDDGVEAQANAEDYTTIRWKFGPVLEPGQRGHVSFNVVLK